MFLQDMHTDNREGNTVARLDRMAVLVLPKLESKASSENE